jgi:tetratricopeptide (TPR) repeat protein
MEEAFGVLSSEKADADFAFLAAQLARLHFFKGDLEVATERLETALEVAEAFALPQVIAEALNTASVVAINKNRPEQSLALVRHALQLALEHDLTSAAFRGYNNVAEALCRRDRYEEALDHQRSGVALARRFGDRIWESMLLAEMTYPLVMLGRWQEAEELAGQIPQMEGVTGTRFSSVLGSLAPVFAVQGKLEKAAELLSRFAASRDSDDVQDRGSFASAHDADRWHRESGREGRLRRGARELLRVRPVRRRRGASGVDRGDSGGNPPGLFEGSGEPVPRTLGGGSR